MKTEALKILNIKNLLKLRNASCHIYHEMLVTRNEHEGQNKQTKTVKSVFCICATHSDQTVLFIGRRATI